MTTSLRSWRCFRRRHLARISIIDMLGESSMKSGAVGDARPISAGDPAPVLVRHVARAHVVQRDPGLRREQAHGDLGACPISSEKITLGRPLVIEQAREKSSARVELWVGTIDRVARYM